MGFNLRLDCIWIRVFLNEASGLRLSFYKIYAAIVSRGQADRLCSVYGEIPKDLRH